MSATDFTAVIEKAPVMTDVSRAYRVLMEELEELCRQVGRNPEELSLLAVSKTVGLSEVEQAIQAGIRLFGENRAEELERKQDAFPAREWHFIGNIQSRRIPQIVEHAELIHSLYRSRHLALIDRAARAFGKVQRVLIEVNASGEMSKGGLAPEELAPFLEEARSFKSLRVEGLMTMAPLGNVAAARLSFEKLAALRASLFSEYEELHELSMGMSQDWQEAVRAGATIIRIGSSIFGSS